MGTTASGTATTSQAVRATILVAILVALTNLVSLAFDPRDHANEAVLVVDVCHGVIALGVAVWFIRSSITSIAVCELGFAVVTLPFVVGLWLPAISDLEAGHLSEPLLPHHFLLLGIAVSAPTLRVGVAFLVLFAGHAIVLGHVLAAGGDPALLAHEPGMTLLFTMIAGLMLFTAHRRRQLAQRVVAAEQRARMLADVAGMLLALRDRANTPLQTLEIAVAMLAEDGGAPEHVAIMQRALSRLAIVQQTLAKSGTELAGIAGETAILPADLEQSLRELLREHV
jgi:hypothetical protein